MFYQEAADYIAVDPVERARRTAGVRPRPVEERFSAQSSAPRLVEVLSKAVSRNEKEYLNEKKYLYVWNFWCLSVPGKCNVTSQRAEAHGG
jgi:hypothetical protein